MIFNEEAGHQQQQNQSSLLNEEVPPKVVGKTQNAEKKGKKDEEIDKNLSIDSMFD